MAGIIPGDYNSSTRTELAGLISTAVKPVGSTPLTDSNGVVAKAVYILSNTGRT